MTYLTPGCGKKDVNIAKDENQDMENIQNQHMFYSKCWHVLKGKGPWRALAAIHLWLSNMEFIRKHSSWATFGTCLKR